MELRKTFRGTIKSNGRQVTAVVSTGFRDKQGDRIHYGAWSDVIRSLNDGRKPVLHWNHQHDNLPIGSIDSLAELPVGDNRVRDYQGQKSNGLLMKATFANTTTGTDALTLLREGHLSGEWSVYIGVDAKDAEYVRGGRDIFKIAALLECSLVDIGAAQNTYTIAASARRLPYQVSDSLVEKIAEQAEDLAWEKINAREEREWYRGYLTNVALAEAMPVAIEQVSKEIVRMAEIERMAGISGNVWKSAPQRPAPRTLTEEQARIKEIRRMAGHI